MSDEKKPYDVRHNEITQKWEVYDTASMRVVKEFRTLILAMMYMATRNVGG